VHNGTGSENQKALFNIVRLKTDIFNQGSYLGFCLADKEIDGSWNRVAGVDGQWRFADIDFHKTTLNVQGQSNIIRWMPFNLYAQIGDTINYDTGDPFLGWGATIGIGVNFKPSARLQLGVDYAKETFWRTQGGERLWDYNVFHTRTIYQLTRSLSVRAIVDYNHFYKQIFGNLLFSYVLRPGTVFFLGFDSNYDRNEFGRYDRRNYNVFVKFSYWWRV